MPHAQQVTVVFDVPEPRVSRGRLVASADGTTWDLDASPAPGIVGITPTGVWIDPVTRTAMCAPLCVRPEWGTTTTGDYARLGYADWDGLSSTNWSEVDRRAPGDIYLQSRGPVNETATSVIDTYPANTPWFLSVVVPGFEGLSDQVFLECGWGEAGEPGSVWLRFRASGSVSIFKGANPVGRYDWQGGGIDVPASLKSSGEKRAGKTVDIVLLPCRWNRLLCVVGGSGFEHEFADLPFAPGPLPDITPEGTFWWRVPPAAGAACVQAVDIRFSGGGVILSRPITLRFPPPLGATFVYRGFGDPIGTGGAPAVTVSLVDPTTGAAFVPNGAADVVRLRAEFVGGAITATQGLYAADAVLPPVATTTANAPVDVTPLLSRVAFSVSESRPASITLESGRISGLTDAGVAQVQVTGDRPFALRIGAQDIVRGTLDMPRLEIDGPPEARGGAGIALKAVWEGADRGAELSFSSFIDTLPYDNALLADAVTTLFEDVGESNTNVLVTSDGFRLPFSPACSKGEWLELQTLGENRGAKLSELLETYCATWWWGYGPTYTGTGPYTAAGYKCRIQAPSAESTTPILDLFEGHTMAAMFGVPFADTDSRVVRDLSIERKRAEANQILVIGYDPLRRRSIYAPYNDAASQAPGTAPGSRPANWRSRVHTVTVTDRKFQTQAVAERARDLLQPRLTNLREFATWESELLVRPATGGGDFRVLWLGDRVRLYMSVSGTGAGTTRGTYRITGIEAESVLNLPNVAPIWRVRYSAEKVA